MRIAAAEAAEAAAAAAAAAGAPRAAAAAAAQLVVCMLSSDDIVEAQRKEGRAERAEGPPRKYPRGGGFMGAPRGGRGRGGGFGGPSSFRSCEGNNSSTLWYSPQSRSRGGPYGRGLGGGAPPRSFVVRISGLDYSVLEGDLKELFESVGGVSKVWIDFDRTDRSLGTGGCVFKSMSDARRAVDAFEGRKIEGRAIHLELQQPRGPPSSYYSEDRWGAGAGGPSSFRGRGGPPFRFNNRRGGSRGGEAAHDCEGGASLDEGAPAEDYSAARRFRERRYVEPW
ncbi:hypothetical protein Esti_001312 [Eimeria stiedai]